VGRGNFGERKIVTDQVGGPPVGLAIGVQGGARLLGRLGQSGNIYITVGQDWLIIKINRRNYSLNIGRNMLYNGRKFSSF
jgi:hypothetical protein